MAECNIDKSCFDDVKMCVKVNSVNGIKPNVDGEVDIDEKFVTTNTTQTIHGSKTFTNTIKTNGMNREAMLTTMNGLKIDTAPTVINKSSIKWNDKEQNEVSSIEVSRAANTKDTCISLSANTITEWGSNEKASVEVHAKAGATSYATAPTPSSNATGNEIVTAEWVIDKGLADDTNVVHKTGREVIGGDKIFQKCIYRQTDVTTDTVGQVYRFDDTNAKPCGAIYNSMHWYNNNVYNRHQAYNATSGKDMYFEVLSHNDGSGVVNTGGSVTNNKNLTAVTNATDVSYVATMGWVNNPATSTNVVHRTGNETIDGAKTFTQEIIIQKGDIDLTTTPTSNKYSGYHFTDKNKKSLGIVQYAQRSTDANDLDLYVFDKNSTVHGVHITTNNEVLPIENNTYSLGSASNKWANVYSDEINTKYFTYTHDNRTSYNYLPETSGTLAIQERTRASAVVENRTLLYECVGGLDLGDITLNDVYSKFNALLIVYSNDDGGGISTYYLDCAELDIRRELAGSGTFLLIDGHSYWACTGASTGFKFVHSKNNGLRIHKIYGLAKYY